MDIKECEEVPLIIGRPFLKPSKMIIDMDKGRSNYKYKMRFWYYISRTIIVNHNFKRLALR